MKKKSALNEVILQQKINIPVSQRQLGKDFEKTLATVIKANKKAIKLLANM